MVLDKVKPNDQLTITLTNVNSGQQEVIKSSQPKRLVVVKKEENKC
jgi:hypothetical protein